MAKNSKFILLIISVLLMSLVLTGCKWGEKTPPDYPTPPVDSNAETLEGNPGVIQGSTVSLSYTKDVVVNLASNTVILDFTNPARSSSSITISVEVDGQEIAKSGLLVPGTKITELDITYGSQGFISAAGEYEGRFLVEFYDAVSGEKAIVNTEIPINITVR